jgi:GT2 family glycosyltransferase
MNTSHESGSAWSNPHASVVICAYTEQRWDDLAAAVESIRQQTVPQLEIIVVCDHNPRLFEHASSQFRDVVVIENSGSRGLSGARNSGTAAARGQVIAFLDDDAIAESDWMERLLNSYEDDRVVGSGGAITPIWLSGRPRWFPEEFLWVVGCTYRGLPTMPSDKVRNLIGCNMSFRRDAVRNVGGFAEGVGQVGGGMLRCDDTDFCIRVRQQQPGRVIFFEPRARVRHRVPAQRSTWRYFVARCFTEGIAKSMISRQVGAASGLSAERAYTFRVLPGGIARNFIDAARRLDFGGLQRAGAIAAGLAITTMGFLVGELTNWLTPVSQAITILGSWL